MKPPSFTATAVAIIVLQLVSALVGIGLLVQTGRCSPLDDLATLPVRPEIPHDHAPPYAEFERPYTSYELDNTLFERIVRYQRGAFSPYTLETFAPGERPDIEHIVSRKEAHDSGLSEQGTGAIRSFVTDLRNLTLASRSVNAAKGERDFASWQPTHNRCWTAARIVEVKRTYGLSVDEPEHAALRHQLHLCNQSAFSGPAR